MLIVSKIGARNKASFFSMSRLVTNVLHFNSLEMTSSDLIQTILGWHVVVEVCIFSRDDPKEGRISSSVQGFVAFDGLARICGVTS